METPSEELTLRDILEILKRQKAWILTLPLLFGAVALIYGFFVAEPTYASTATLSVAPVQVQAQLEQRIQVQQATPITFEGLKALAADGVPFVPDLEALRPLVCKRSQRELLNRFNLPSPAWFPLDRVQESPELPPEGETPKASSAPLLADPAPQLPQGFAYPLMAKAASGGYDGKGTAVLRSDADLEALLERVDPSNWIVEEFVAFDLELAVVAARDQMGDVVCLPVVQTHQHQQLGTGTWNPILGAEAATIGGRGPGSPVTVMFSWTLRASTITPLTTTCCVIRMRMDGPLANIWRQASRTCSWPARRWPFGCTQTISSSSDHTAIIPSRSERDRAS